MSLHYASGIWLYTGNASDKDILYVIMYKLSMTEDYASKYATRWLVCNIPVIFMGASIWDHLSSYSVFSVVEERQASDGL